MTAITRDEPNDVPASAEASALWERTLPLLLLFLAGGAVVFAFACATILNRAPGDMASPDWIGREPREVADWIDHGYFDSAGLIVRRAPSGDLITYRSSTGAVLISGFIVEKIYSLATGRVSPRLLSLHNEAISLLAAALLGLLGFRLARRIGVRWLHAAALGLALEAVIFTFPGNLMQYWELQAGVCWLAAACAFLLIAERSGGRSTRRAAIGQAAAVFLMVYFEYVAGLAFVASYLAATFLLDHWRSSPKRLVLVIVVPVLLALGVYKVQLAVAAARHPERPVLGSDFAMRTGFDGDTTYYGGHLDIAYGRVWARNNFNAKGRAFILRWPWLFFAAAAATLAVVVLAMFRRVPLVAMLALLSLLGTYLLYAAVFSEAVVIHPYLYDGFLLAPLALALFVLLPALIESSVPQRGLAVTAVILLAAWVAMVQMRQYAMAFPAPVKGLSVGEKSKK